MSSIFSSTHVSTVLRSSCSSLTHSSSLLLTAINIKKPVHNFNKISQEHGELTNTIALVAISNGSQIVINHYSEMCPMTSLEPTMSSNQDNIIK